MRIIVEKNKSLKDMTLEELWGLFPIVLVPHNHKWTDWAKQEIELLSALLARYNPIISHIGSTAIPNIQAKPIVDILVEVSADADWQPIKDIMEANGYICMSESEKRVSFNKGYTLKGYADKVFHIHFHRTEDNNEVLFRDYLMEHPDIAREYEQLKIFLLLKYKNNRNGHTDAKSDFIQRIIQTIQTEPLDRKNS